MEKKRWRALVNREQNSRAIDSGGREMALQSNSANDSKSAMEGQARRSQPEAMRCDHCRKPFGLILHRYFRMRFCSADCLTAYQGRLDDLTVIKIRCLELPHALSN